MIKTQIKIEGMSCGMCESHINDIIRASFAVRKASSSRKKKLSQVVSDAPLDEQKLREAIAAAGYTVLEVKTEEYVKKGLFS